LGWPEFRQTIAAYYNEAGLPTSENQILVTNGAQQAISLVAALYLQRGDNVIIDNPTYFGAIDAFRAVGARLNPLRVEPKGIRPDALRAQIEASFPRLIYIQPNFHNPTGAVLSEKRRREVVQIAKEFDIPLVEDNTLGEITLDGETLTPLASYATADNHYIITIGSMSKLFWAGLRIGWIRAAEPIVTRLGRLKVMNDLGTSVVNQVMANRLLATNAKIKVARQLELQPKLELLTNLLAEMLPDWTWTRPRGGLFLWIKLPIGDADTFAQVASRFNVTIIPGNIMSVDETHQAYLRLPFLADAGTLTEAVQRLARAWEVYLPLLQTERTLTKVIV
jgi:DNA-binding transcriptional MocR family regulator